ncbi:MAG: DUF2238 domain-containing protein [Dongiaceae bacterium]
MPKNRNPLLIPAILVVMTGIWSIINPYELMTWFLEASPIIIIFLILLATHRRFTFTPLAYWLMALGAILVLIGAHYTYARVPLFNELKENFSLERNYYDRFGHFFQGFIPAIIFRELLLRTSGLRLEKWLFVVVVAMCATKSMLYEFAEWWATVIVGENAHEFLAMQGDQWDAQQDMFWATVGSIISLLTLSHIHDRQLAKHTKKVVGKK